MQNLKPVLPAGIRQASQEDWREVAHITAEAFRDDPVINWTVCNNKSIPAVFRHLARDVYLKRGLCYLIEDQGATMWLTPEQSKELPALSMTGLALKVLGNAGPEALVRTLAMDKKMLRAKPKTPHMYLFSVGVLKSGRGKGLGRQLLKPMLDACAAAGLPVYLENSNPANHGFYTGLGFEVMGPSISPDKAPPLVPMWFEAEHPAP